METSEIFKKLAEPFDPKDLEWRAGAYSENNKKAMALAYMDARAVMYRLDEVVGPQNWIDSYQAISGDGGKRGFLCSLSIRIDGEWITKTDGADESDFEPIKGGLSDAFKRAANKWGIGRYLYALEAEWVKAEKNGKMIKLLEFPKLPLWAVPESMQNTYNKKTPATPAKKTPAAQPKLDEAGQADLDHALAVIIPTNIPVPFAGKSMKEAIEGGSVGVLVVKYLAGSVPNQTGLYFKPLGDEEKLLQVAAKTIAPTLG